MIVVWLTACGWFSASESEVKVPTATASLTGKRPAVAPRVEAKPLTEDQVAVLDQLFVRTTELVRSGEPGAFTSATITFVQTDLEEFHPERGEAVTVVPAVGSLGPRTLEVTEVTEAELFVQLTTTHTTAPDWLAAPAPAGERPEMIGRATLLHPVVEEAAVGEVATDLPEGITAATLVARVDVSGDGVADIVTSEHCCDDPTVLSGDACDGRACVVTWVRTGGETGWRIAEES